MKNQKFSRALMTLITVFSTVFITVYVTKIRLPQKRQPGIFSDTIYNSKNMLSYAVKASEFENAEETAVTVQENRIDATQTPQEISAENTSGTGNAPAVNTSSQLTEEIPGNTEVQNPLSGISTEFIKIYDHKNQTVREMPLEEYVSCVVASEMPSDSPMEALKAQSVAVRTLAVKYILELPKDGHFGADICTDSGHCQAFADKEEFIKQYGEAGEKVFRNTENAAKATKGMILTYEDQPIIAVFHASSGNRTASGKEVWGGELDYLVSVETEEIYDEELKDKVVKQAVFTRQEFFDKLSASGAENLEQYKNSPFHTFIGRMELSDSGRVASLNIAGKSFSGREIRSILGLKSADFEISFGDDSVTFITKGYGHGVGMSQLGAVAMANDGESFYSILGKYYPGTILSFI